MPGQSGPKGPGYGATAPGGGGRKRENEHSLPGSGAGAGPIRKINFNNQLVMIKLGRLTPRMGGQGLRAGPSGLENEMPPLRPAGHGDTDTDRYDEQQGERESYEKALH